MNKPPYISKLTNRRKYSRDPILIHIHAGRRCWQRAKADDSSIVSLVWDGKDYDWPVVGCSCLVEIDPGPTKSECEDFACRLISSGAETVILWWMDGQVDLPNVYWADGSLATLDLNDLRQIFGETA